jgi:pimeloyl-ACP methyl ester carboxylesterase
VIELAQQDCDVDASLPEVSARDLPGETLADTLLTWIGGAVDGAVLQAMGMAIGAFLMPAEGDLPSLLASALPFVAGPLAEEPRLYFDFLGRTAPLVEGQTRTRRRIGSGAVVERRFAASYRRSSFAAVSPGEDGAGGDDLLIDHWTRQPRRPLGTVVALHGFTMGSPRIDAVALFAEAFFRRGIDVALVTLPFHGRRTPPGARFSGEHFAVPDVGRLNESVRQAVYEIEGLVDWLRRSSGAPVGLLGLSLGGYIAALLGGLRDDLDFVVPMAPPVCFGDLAWRFFQRSRGGEEAPGFSLEQLRLAFRVHSPLTYPLALPRERAFIVAGRGDRIVPAAHPHALWRHWGAPPIHWFSGGHLAPFGRAKLIAAVVEHVERCCRDA